MSEKFQNKYRIPSTRLKNWDYASEGAYFTTICTVNRVHYFGEIENRKMILSNAGLIADLMWHEIRNHTKNITLGEFVVMPDHIHGILINNYENELQTLHATPIHEQIKQNETLHATNPIIQFTLIHTYL